MTTIEFITTYDGVTGLQTFSAAGTERYGQTFKTPNATDVLLTEFTFLIDLLGVNSVTFKAYLYEWSGTAPTGPALYESEERTQSVDGFTEQSYSPNVVLDPAKTYIFYLSAISGAGTARFGATQNDDSPYPHTDFYADGKFWFQNGAAIWLTYDDADPEWHFDLAFSAEFGESTPTDSYMYQTL